MTYREKNKKILKNIFVKKIYLSVLIISIVGLFILPTISQKVILPPFYNYMVQNVLDEASKVGIHIARHQDMDQQSNVFHTAINKLKSDFDIVKIKLFDKDGYIVFSTDKKDIGNKNSHDYFYNTVAKGEMLHKIVTKGTKTFEGVVVAKDVIEIYVPIVKNNKFEGASEIYYDITTKRENLNKIMNNVLYIIYAISFLFLVVILFMLYVSSKINLEHEEKENQLFQQSKLASLGEMMGNIAHQWRQPLSAISSSISGAKVQKQLGLLTDDEESKIFDKVLDSTLFLSNTIEDFRNFFKTDKTFSKVHLSSIVGQVLSVLNASLSSNNIKTVVNIEDTEFVTLGGELKQAILNIINNASDALKDEKNKELEERLIIIDSKLSHGRLKISITDNAGGIPENIIDKIFEPYFTTKHQSQGTGIGLFMTERIIQRHLKGSLSVENITFEHNGFPYTGARFNITLYI